jgi:hypothetical protein
VLAKIRGNILVTILPLLVLLLLPFVASVNKGPIIAPLSVLTFITGVSDV